ncbi:MAG: HpaII family restriction endonuclease [Muribaculaceae bacterium]|nr:HpaII family restriction endonuclease [Muribaculaceae bacterium]
MSELKAIVKDLVGQISWGVSNGISNCWIRVSYGNENYIVNASDLLDLCNDDAQLSVSQLLSRHNQYPESGSRNIIGEIRIVDTARDSIGFFNVKQSCENKDLFRDIFYNNLRFIDLGMPMLLTEIVRSAKSEGINKISEIYERVKITNPLDVDNDWIENVYLFKIGRLLYNFATGLTEAAIWDGSTPTGGIVFISNGSCSGFNYFDQSALGNFLIDSCELTSVDSALYFKFSH